MRIRRNTILLALPLLGASSAGIWLVSAPARTYQLPNPEIWDCLRIIAAAQEEFLERDGDHNGRADYWRKDVAGLERMMEVQGQSRRGTGCVIAGADDRPLREGGAAPSSRAFGGYLFRAIRHADESSYDPRRFAVAAFPAVYTVSIRVTYIIDEKGVIWEKDAGPGGVEVFPARPTNEGWKKL